MISILALLYTAYAAKPAPKPFVENGNWLEPKMVVRTSGMAIADVYDMEKMNPADPESIAIKTLQDRQVASIGASGHWQTYKLCFMPNTTDPKTKKPTPLIDPKVVKAFMHSEADKDLLGDVSIALGSSYQEANKYVLDVLTEQQPLCFYLPPGAASRKDTLKIYLMQDGKGLLAKKTYYTVDAIIEEQSFGYISDKPFPLETSAAPSSLSLETAREREWYWTVTDDFAPEMRACLVFTRNDEQYNAAITKTEENLETAVFTSPPLRDGTAEDVTFVAIDRNKNMTAFSYAATVDSEGFLVPTTQKTSLPAGYAPCPKKQGNSETE